MRAVFFLACLFTLGAAWWFTRGCGWTHETVTRRDTATGMRRCLTCRRAYADMQESGELDGKAFLRPTKAGAFFNKYDGSRGVTREQRH